MNNSYDRTRPRRRVITVAVAGTVVATLAATAHAADSSAGSGQSRQDVTITTTPDYIEVGPCPAEHLVLTLENESSEPVYADVFVEASEPIAVSREVVSSYLPAGHRIDVPLRLDVPTDISPGEYELVFDLPGANGEREVTPVETDGSLPGQGCLQGEQLTASASSAQLPAYGPEKAVDGDRATFWHSQYRPNEPHPHTLTLTLDEPYDITELRYLPRSDNWAGIITDYTIYAGSGDGPLAEVSSGTWRNDVTEKVAFFDAPNADRIQLVANEGNRANSAAAEIVLVGTN